MPVRFVYFDLDDTLLDHRRAEAAGAGGRVRGPPGRPSRRTRSRTSRPPTTPTTPHLWRDYAAGRLRREDVQHLRFARTLATLGLTALDPDALGEHYLARYAEHWSFLDGAATAFHAVADRFPVGLLTNGFAEIQHAKLNRFPDLRERAQVPSSSARRSATSSRTRSSSTRPRAGPAPPRRPSSTWATRTIPTWRVPAAPAGRSPGTPPTTAATSTSSASTTGTTCWPTWTRSGSEAGSTSSHPR
ncbi:MAG: hypothetical protein KatS3mg042_1749 [Rhodothermaceae bacterium]|nr:MAG: hypothetical protein KatS3mg042_1749 [Rhodothermaceae bacterium]